MTIPQPEPVLILGGGLMGLTIAHQLAREGKSVQILNRRKEEAAGWAAAGMLAPHAEGLQGPLLRLGQLSQRKIPIWIKQIEAESSIKCELIKSGIVVPFSSEIERDKHPNNAFAKTLNRTELEKEVPGISRTWGTALLFKEDGQIDNRRQLMRALRKACINRGVNIQEGITITNIIHENNILQGIQTKNLSGKIKNISGKKAVLCCGAWSNKIFPRMPIFPVKGQMFSIQGPKFSQKRIIFGPKTYVVPRQDGLIIIGATSEKYAGFEQGLTPNSYNWLLAGLESLLPNAIHLPQMEHWWGYRPCTPDEMPILGTSSIEGLWLATGHHRNGILLAAITSELISKLICEQSLNPEEAQLLGEFHWNRFQPIKR